MAIGRAVITTNSPGCKDTVINNVNGYKVPAGDINSLVIAMEKFILNPKKIIDMGKHSRIMAERKYDVEYVNKIFFNYVKI